MDPVIPDNFLDVTGKIYDFFFVSITLMIIPILISVGTSFAKISIVLSLIRNALGVQQIPSNMTLYGIALILTLYVMKPVIAETYNAYQNYASTQKEQPQEQEKLKQISNAISITSKPFMAFLKKNTRSNEINFFVSTAKVIWPEKYSKTVVENDLLILLPAFAVSEITKAFAIGFLIYLPFIVIDLVISNILLTLGMMMVSPSTISLPFKLLLFVMIDGWSRLMHGLVLTYQ